MLLAKCPLSTASFFFKNARLLSIKRPLSPHLSIYSFQLTTVLSIGHRFSGVALGTIVYGFGLISAGYSIDVPKCTKWLRNNIPAPIISISKFIITLPFTYHSFNGIRHLVIFKWQFIIFVGVGFGVLSLYKFCL